MSEAIRVIVRVRPPTTESIAVEVEDSEVVVQRENGSFVGRFAAVVETDQEAVFDEVRPLVASVAAGFNACVLAYGQTGSGKTWSMFGDDALVPRAVKLVFEQLEEPEWQVEASFLQIYGERLSDLLTSDVVPLRIRENHTRELYVSGLSSYRCASADEVLALVARGLKSRVSRSTRMNDQSSRSHAVLKLVVETRRDKEVARSKLYLVDLAGSERVADLKSGEGFAEHVSINQSLSALGNVVAALAERTRKHVPYRDALLTRLLQDCLGGNSRTALVACIAPDAVFAEETMRTLRFAERASNVVASIKANKEIVDDCDAATLRRALKKANAEIDRLKLALEQRRPHQKLFEQAGLSDECDKLREANAKLVAENAKLRAQLLPPAVENDDVRSLQHLLEDLETSVGGPPVTTPTTTTEADDLLARCDALDEAALMRLLDTEQDAVGTALADDCAHLKRIRAERLELEAQLGDIVVEDVDPPRASHTLKPAPPKTPQRPVSQGGAPKLALFGDGRDVGARVEIFSYRFNRSYAGDIASYDPDRGMHCVHYESGERQWQELGAKQVTVLRPGNAPPARKRPSTSLSPSLSASLLPYVQSIRKRSIS